VFNQNGNTPASKFVSVPGLSHQFQSMLIMPKLAVYRRAKGIKFRYYNFDLAMIIGVFLSINVPQNGLLEMMNCQETAV